MEGGAKSQYPFRLVQLLHKSQFNAALLLSPVCGDGVPLRGSSNMVSANKTVLGRVAQPGGHVRILQDRS